MPARVLAAVELPAVEQFARAVPQCLDMVGILRHPVARLGGGSAHTGDQRGGHRARTQPEFLTAPGLDFVQVDPVAHPQRADPLGAVELVRRNRDHVGAGHFDLAIGLHRITEIQRVVLLRLAVPFDRWLDGPDLVVDLHQADQPRICGQVLPGVALPVPSDIEDMAGPGIARGVEHRGVFDRRNRYRALGSAAADCQVDRLGRAAGEDHLPARGEQRGNLVAGHFDRGLGLPSHAMRAVRIAETGPARPVQPAHHRVARFGRKRGGGLVIEVDHCGLIQ